MAAEAASTGKPVFVLPMEGGSVRIGRFHEELQARGAARPFQGRLPPAGATAAARDRTGGAGGGGRLQARTSASASAANG